MNWLIVKVTLIVATLVLLSACSLAPLTPRSDAASIGKNRIKTEATVLPTASLGVVYGAGNNVDVGLELEQGILVSAWTRYSFINNPNGLSFAGNAAAFLNSGEFESNGWYAGLLFSNQMSTNTRLSAGIRYAVLDYEFAEPISGGFFIDPDLNYDNPDEPAHNAQVDLMMSMLLRTQFEFSFGVSCQRILENANPTGESDRCLPLIGLSSYRR